MESIVPHHSATADASLPETPHQPSDEWFTRPHSLVPRLEEGEVGEFYAPLFKRVDRLSSQRDREHRGPGKVHAKVRDAYSSCGFRPGSGPPARRAWALIAPARRTLEILPC